MRKERRRSRASPYRGLTKRNGHPQKRQVISLLLAGAGGEEVSERLGLTPRTVARICRAAGIEMRKKNQRPRKGINSDQ